MDIRYSGHPNDVKHYTTEQLRKEFHIPNVFQPGKITMVYSHVDRMMSGGAMPLASLTLEAGSNMGVTYFLERREMGIINIGSGAGLVETDDGTYELLSTDGLYVGRGNKKVVFSSKDSQNPAKFYWNSAPAHRTCPTAKVERKNIEPRHLGSIEESNERKLYQYFIPGRVETCQLEMGLTALEPGNMWNSMPPHTHERRMEVYFYFNLPEGHTVMHFMGEPQETRHIIMHNEEAVISPSWSIHCGVGTHNYTFIWGMCGENQDFDDMDNIERPDLR
jgi:5-keto 4-deoxyuronate isomerase